MAVAVVAYPRMDAGDREWIEGFRALHDPQASKIPPHFTVVFPREAPVRELERCVSAVACATSEFAFALGTVRAHRDPDGRAYVFLIPEEGAHELRALHAELNPGTLSPVPFEPHITVGTHEELESAEAQVRAMRARWRMVRGVVDALDLVEVGDAGVATIARYPLSGGPGVSPTSAPGRSGER